MFNVPPAWRPLESFPGPTEFRFDFWPLSDRLNGIPGPTPSVPEKSPPGSETLPDETLEKRLRAVERAITETDRDLTDLADAAERAERLESLENRCERLEARVEELNAALEAVRGYVGAVRAVNREVERRADAALAATRSGDHPDRTGSATGSPVPGSVPRDCPDDGSRGPDRTGGQGADPDDLEEATSRDGGDDPDWPGLENGGDDPRGCACGDPTDAGERETGSTSGSPVDSEESSGGRARRSSAPGGDSSGGTESPVEMGWEPVEPAGRESTATTSDVCRPTSDDPDLDGPGIDDPRPGTGESPLREASGESGSRERGNGFEWPPGEGLDVDRAQPWSAPDLPPADPDEDRSLLERLREAL